MSTGNETKTANNVETPDRIKTKFLSIVYKKSFIEKLLQQTKGNYTLVGLLINKLHSKDFVISKLYYRPSNKKAFEQDVFTKNGSAFVDHYFNSTKETNRFREHDDLINVDNEQKWQLKDPSQQIEIKEKSNLQFWDVIDDEENSKLKPFVFFSRYSLEFLTRRNVDRICISGANIDYGVGFYNFGSEGVDEENKTSYPTLKAEINPDALNEGNNTPNVALALPSPPAWDDDEESAKQEQPTGKNHYLNTTFFGEVIANYLQYVDETKETVQPGLDNPRSFEMMPKDFYGNLAENWNQFLTGKN